MEVLQKASGSFLLCWCTAASPHGQDPQARGGLLLGRLPPAARRWKGAARGQGHSLPGDCAQHLQLGLPVFIYAHIHQLVKPVSREKEKRDGQEEAQKHLALVLSPVHRKLKGGSGAAPSAVKSTDNRRL